MHQEASDLQESGDSHDNSPVQGCPGRSMLSGTGTRARMRYARAQPYSLRPMMAPERESVSGLVSNSLKPVTRTLPHAGEG